MVAFTYESIRPLVVRVRSVGDRMDVGFRCPVSGELIEAEARIAGGQERPNVLDAIARALSGAVRTMFPAEAEAGEADAAIEAGLHHAPSDDERRAIVAAFASVAPHFVFDPGHNRWVSRRAAMPEGDDLSTLLARHPVTRPADRDLLVHLLAAVAAADGRFARREAQMMEDMGLADAATVARLAAAGPPGPDVLATATLGPERETMIALAWAVALADEALAPPERQLVDTAAAALGIGRARSDALRHSAERFILDRAIALLAATGPITSFEETALKDVAARLGLGPDDMARELVRFRTAHGLS